MLFRRKKPSKPIVLKGGRGDVVVEKIRQGRRLGGNREGVVHNAYVTVRKGEKRKKIVLAEKKFRKKKQWPGLHHLRDPLAQFETMRGLLELNRKKGLGLHILPTIRLREMDDSSYRLILTRFKEYKFGTKSVSEMIEAEEIHKRDRKVLKENGYSLGGDCFSLIKDPETGKPRWFITDFGGVVKVKP